jgi:hypothetical protein
MRASERALVASVLVAACAGCFAGSEAASGSATLNGSTASLVTARQWAGGKDEGPLGFTAGVSRSLLVDELRRQGVYPEELGPLNQIHDQRALVAVMKSFSRALGVRCTWCHVATDYAAPTARKTVTAFMWDAFVGQLQLVDGSPLYCDSCHHQSTVFLHRNVSDKLALAKYMQSEYVDQLRRRDGESHGCATCHDNPFNPRFLPRASDPPGWRAPVAEPGPQE